MPPNIEWDKEKPDLWIEPESSVILQVKTLLFSITLNKCKKNCLKFIIVQVKATEIMKSHTLKSKMTLRFPRVEKVRYDKPWYDGMTVGEFESIIKV